MSFLYDDRWSVARVTLIYAVFSAAWIYSSDSVLLWWLGDAEAITRIQIVKGWAFVGASTLLLYVLLSREDRHRRRAEASLRASERALRGLNHRLESVREEERSGIAREIHDRLGQALTQLMMDVSWLGRRDVAEAEPVRARLGQMVECIEETIGVVRRISSELRPGVLDDLGLVSALEWQAREFGERSGIDCRVEDRTDDASPSPAAATAVFRIYQEILTNIARHADATRIDAVLSVRGGRLVLEVTDNGRGITLEQAQGTDSIGLLGMRERAAAVEGRFSIGAVDEAGTRAEVWVPLTGGGVERDAAG